VAKEPWQVEDDATARRKCTPERASRELVFLSRGKNLKHGLVQVIEAGGPDERASRSGEDTVQTVFWTERASCTARRVCHHWHIRRLHDAIGKWGKQTVSLVNSVCAIMVIRQWRQWTGFSKMVVLNRMEGLSRVSDVKQKGYCRDSRNGRRRCGWCSAFVDPANWCCPKPTFCLQRC